MIKILKPFKSINIIFIIYTLLLALPASYEPHHFAKALFLGAVFHSIIYSIFLLWLGLKNKMIGHIITIVLLFLFSLETFVYIIFGSRFSPNILSFITQTTAKETIEFIGTFILQPLPIVLFIGIVVFWIVIIRIIGRKRSSLQIKTKSLKTLVKVVIIGFGLLMYFVPLPFPSGENTIENLSFSIKYVMENHREVETMKTMIREIKVERLKKDEIHPAIVVIIGESFNKHHSSLYGYYLPTSKELEKEKNAEKLFVFNDVWTPTNATNVAMRYIFTMKRCNEKGYEPNACVLVPAVFKKSGYKVAYFDNQYTRSIAGVLDFSCNFFLNPTEINDNCFDFRNDKIFDYDGDFIAQYSSDFLLTEKSFNIIHLMGQHFDTEKRFPREYCIFKAVDIQRPDLNEEQRATVASYDNAVYYNDKVVSEIISKFRNTNAVVIYFSDHGERIYDGESKRFGRQYGYKDEETLKNEFQIPFFIWCSDKYISLQGEKYNQIRNSVDRKFCMADVPYLLFDLAGINFTEYQNKYSLISPEFCPHDINFD